MFSYGSMAVTQGTAKGAAKLLGLKK